MVKKRSNKSRLTVALMWLKKFFSVTKPKIKITIIICILTFLIQFISLACIFPGGIIDYCRVLTSIMALLNFLLSSGLGELLMNPPQSFYQNQALSSIFQIGGSIIVLILAILQAYIFSCFFVWIYKKIKDKKDNA